MDVEFFSPNPRARSANKRLQMSPILDFSLIENMKLYDAWIVMVMVGVVCFRVRKKVSIQGNHGMYPIGKKSRVAKNIQ